MEAPEIGAIEEVDLNAAMDITNADFSGFIETTYGKKRDGPHSAPLMGR